ncbi:metalloregulator ArsR/SmtB family transcription factor [Kiloniella laminariae]|uniref:Metalloregulator ArsR/SmtB family transcription factor n=1 Tax=Kiloniella laminariae TaxID=454162 RepID=A0ABT4LJE7_9PROT|nr:metalloregulator ArsR/SmtB family transcription factor [Kiloniella laminariae]MCZ4281230.1 metalloregulator ArsR/SmtB family transcription factor [Kiloniella laminariae]
MSTEGRHEDRSSGEGEATREPDCCDGLPYLDRSGLESLSNIFHTLGDEGRLRLCLCCFAQACSVSELSLATGQSQSLTSHNLRQLRDARILVARKDGRRVLYELADQHIRHVIADMAHHVLEEHPPQ